MSINNLDHCMGIIRLQLQFDLTYCYIRDKNNFNSPLPEKGKSCYIFTCINQYHVCANDLFILLTFATNISQM